MKNMLASLGFAALLTGCYVHGSGGAYVSAPVAVVEVEEESPPPQYEEVVVRPGFIWIQGNYQYSGGRYVWMGGHYERERAGYMYAPGRWERRGRGHVWVEGRWNAGAANRAERNEYRENVRDHREERREERGRGPVVRDHR